MTRLLFLALLLATLSPDVAAQVIQPPQKRGSDQWIFGAWGIVGIPVGDFRRNENGGGGLALMAGYQPIRRQPLYLRGEFTWLAYGRINRDVEDDYCDFTGCYTEVVYYDSRNHMMFTFQAGPEISPVKGKWRPFLFALAGSTVFHSYAILGYPSGDTSPPSETLNASANFSTSYGGGIRLMDEKQSRAGGFELSAHVTRNAKADYLTDRGVTMNPDGTWTVRPIRGPAHVVIVKLGFWVGPNVPWFER